MDSDISLCVVYSLLLGLVLPSGCRTEVDTNPIDLPITTRVEEPVERAPRRETLHLAPGAEVRFVRGNSLQGLLEDGDAITVMPGYYDSHEPKRGEIVTIRWAGQKTPLVKVVRGVSGDRFALRRGATGWSIEVNGRALATTVGKPYVLSDRNVRLLQVYEKDYKGVIPANALLLLGNQPGGSTDATTFGLVDRTSLIAKVLVREDGTWANGE